MKLFYYIYYPLFALIHTIWFLSTLSAMKKIIIYFLISFACFETVGQKSAFEVPDTLISKSYQYYNHQILANQQDVGKSILYARSWIAKAKKERNFIQLSEGYKAMMHRVKRAQKLVYVDSMVVSAVKSSEDLQIGSAYLTKGLLYYEGFEHVKALDNYIIANKHISKTRDKYMVHKVKYAIAQTRYFLGYYQDAISLLRECASYFKDENETAYISSLHALALSYNRTGQFNLSSQTNSLGLLAMQESENFKLKPYFIQSEGVNQYFKKDYLLAIKLISSSIPELRLRKDASNQAVGNFYIGKSYWDMKMREKAVHYFKMVDQVFTAQNYIRPDLRENYELLINYYKAKHDTDLQLFYIDQLFRLDSILKDQNTYLVSQITKEYDTKKLVQEKKDIEHEKILQGLLATLIISLLLGLVIFLIYRHLRNKKRYRHFEQIMNNPINYNHASTTTVVATDSKTKLKPEVELAILNNLENFENTHQYLDKGMNLNKVALRLKTNTKYVTTILLDHRDKGIIEYISDLKIDYIVERLKTEKKYRNYTNEALGDISGFGSTQIFTKTFKSRTGMSPTWFIQELKKSDSSSAF